MFDWILNIPLFDCSLNLRKFFEACMVAILGRINSDKDVFNRHSKTFHGKYFKGSSRKPF